MEEDELLIDVGVDELDEDDTNPAEEIATAYNVEVESTCHECRLKDDKIKDLKLEVDKLKREITTHRREREKQRIRLLDIDAGSSFFRTDQLKFLRKNNLRGYSWTKETLRDALKIRFSGIFWKKRCALLLAKPEFHCLPEEDEQQKKYSVVNFLEGFFLLKQ